MRFTSSAFALLALTAPSLSQSLLVCHFSQNGGRHVAAFDPLDGSLLTASFINLDGFGSVNRPQQAVLANGEWWVTDNVTETAHVWSRFGSIYSREEFGFNGDTEGGTTAYGSSWFTAQEAPFAPGTLIEVTSSGQMQHPIPSIASPAGVCAFNGDLVVAGQNTVVRIDPTTGAEIAVLYTSFSQQGFLQPTVRPSTGNLLIARQAGHQDVIELDASGVIVQELEFGNLLGLSLVFGCIELGNGDFLLSTETGVYVVDPTLTTFRQELAGVKARFITAAPTVTVGTIYCSPTTVNSTGEFGKIAATGSSMVSVGELRVSAHDLPTFASGYFIASQTQGFVMNPGGSAGNLCLGGTIGRFVMQIGFTSTVNYIDITVDTASMPQPNTTLPILVGQSWNWQAWYRDSVGGQATSNFTDAVSVVFN